MPGHVSLIPEATVREFLDSLEREEAKLLTWGVVDGGFTEQDVIDRAREFTEGRDGEPTDPEVLVAELIRRRLVVDLPSVGGRIIRTRMSEAVRLFARLRQMFQLKHWRSGATLVSDFRFALRPREYPRRDISAADAFAQWKAAAVLTGARPKALRALLTRPGFNGLAGFQIRATERVFRDLDGTWSRGMIVAVGTGSGKTLAFYLPALAHITSLITTEYWTKALALYPRNELLKDQFSEAYREARRLDALVQADGRRKIIVGAFFGPTPSGAKTEELEKKEWRKTSGGFICPYLRCPHCDGELEWHRTDVEAGVERLECTNRHVIAEDEICLTRQRMQERPPDILFTTTEMLNRVMSDGYSRHVFGIGAAKTPQMMLLDEVHTYTGTHGAQVALLLRRWRHAIRRRVQFTGLSATLRPAREFFAQLTGLPETAIEEIAPSVGELETEGMEYLLALRGDPASRASLLSTTIQAVMLLGRVLDPRTNSLTPETSGDPSVYGRKVFVFTDDLDVTNRLFHNLLDAEGADQRNIPRPGRLPLASLRSSAHPENRARLLAGQSWQLCEQIGHSAGLQVPLNIGRTSSQDAGVDQRSDVVVATASLEVGYNDPAVGAVVQHKAPRDAASFLQRKGRAGRLRSTRPWTVVVLSDYGRDRLAYQSYEALFSPVLSSRVLPIANRYVLRIQAGFALMDWLAGNLGNSPRGSVYRDLIGPSNHGLTQQRHQREAQIIRRLLEGDEPLMDSLKQHLADALGVTSDEVQALMWAPPRSLMMEVLPTVLRRLESGWTRVILGPGEVNRDYIISGSPLPDFLPPSLFADLNLPEVTICTLPWAAAATERTDSLTIDQALRTLVPGKVTRRFAVRSSTVSHWVSLPRLDPDATDQQIAVEDICPEFEELGAFAILSGDQSIGVRCVRPWVIRPAITPWKINATSNAWPEWQTQIIPDSLGLALEVPETSEWSAHVREVRLHAHIHRSHIEVRRFATGARANVRFRGPNAAELNAHVRYVTKETGEPAAIGFTAAVDGLCFRINPPSDNIASASDQNAEKIRSFRTAYFRHRVLTDPALSAETNEFQREWLCLAYVSALIAWAIKDCSGAAIPLEEANDAMQQKVAPATAKVLRVIFETLLTPDVQDVDDDDDRREGSATNNDANRHGGRLLGDTLDLLSRPTVVDRLQQLARVLWQPPDEDWLAWAKRRYQATLGVALLEACRQLCPEAAADDLILDINSGPQVTDGAGDPAGARDIWITETAIGGGGVIEEVARRYAEDPRKFFRLVESALGPSDYEITDSALGRVLDLLETNDAVASAVREVRETHQHADLLISTERLEEVLARNGVQVNRTVMNAVHARILRPGSSPRTDALMLGLLRRWRAQEEQLGVEIDARVFSYLASEDDELARALTHIDPAITSDRAFRFHAIYGLLWPRGNVIRSAALAAYNPYAPLPESDRELVRDHVYRDAASIVLSSPDWHARLADELRTRGIARLFAASDQRNALKRAILGLAAEPLEAGFLHLFAQVEGVERDADGFVATLYLPESIQ